MKNYPRQLASFWLATACCLCTSVSAFAQNPFGYGGEAYGDPFGVYYERESEPAFATEMMVGGERPLTPEQQQALASVQGFMEIQDISRTPADILRAKAPPPSPPQTTAEPDSESGDAEAEFEAEQQAAIAALQSSLVRGDWTSVKAQLAKLPPLGAPFVYSHLLTILAEGNTIRPDEIPAIADAAPGNLENEQCVLLGQLLKRSLAFLDRPRIMLETIRSGSDQLGGDSDLRKRGNAARVLLAADMLSEASEYVDFSNAASDAAEFELLDLCSLLEFTRQQQTPLEERTDEMLTRAWSYSVRAFARKTDDADAQAIELRLITLVAEQPPEVASQWLVELEQNAPEDCTSLVISLLVQAEQAFLQGNDTLRRVTLEAAAQFGNTFSAVSNADDTAWNEKLQWLAIPWLNEALKTSGESKRLIVSSDDSDIQPLEESSLQAISPAETWIARLPADTAAMAIRLKGLFAARAGDWETVRSVSRDLAEYDVEIATEVVDNYLASLGQGSQFTKQVDQIMQQYQGQGYSAATLASYRQYYMQQMMEEGGGGGGVALTRAQQLKSLTELRELQQELTEAQLPKPSRKALVETFIGLHSEAEVYTRADIENVFGPADMLDAETMTELTRRMREKLAQQWRDERIQTLAGTKRNKAELAQEVVRGYEVAAMFLQSCVQRNADNFDLKLLEGLLLFDQSEYLYGLGSDLPTYIELRDRAFASVRAAADSYAKFVVANPDKLSVDVYQRWFQIALGASDLAYLTRQVEADESQIALLGESIRSLPSPLADKHLELFGTRLGEELESVPPALKQRCMRESLRVLGDHPAGDPARELDAYYASLLGELELHTAIDGSNQVGFGQPFGLEVSVRYSTPLGREAGDFVSLIGKEYDDDGNETDNKDKLEKELREKWSESFEIQELRFHPPTVKRQSYGREGWRETPLAYLILAAKDPSVDTLAAIQIDVLFRDGNGMVLLPIVSRKLLLDARNSSTKPRPVAELTVKQTLDDRQLGEGRMKLEIQSMATGLAPEFAQLFGFSEGSLLSDFQVTKIDDHGISVSEFDHSSGQAKPKCERAWSITLEPAAPNDFALGTSFDFPQVLDSAAMVSYEKFSDADIIPVEATVPLPSFATSNPFRFVVFAMVSLVGLFLLGLGIYVWRRPSGLPEQTAYPVPHTLTPFTVVSFLRRIANDSRLAFSRPDQESLQTAITELESYYFAASASPITSNAASEPSQLQEIFDRWNAKVQESIARVVRSGA